MTDWIDFVLVPEPGPPPPNEFSVSSAARTLFCDTVSQAGVSNAPVCACATLIAS
jgi:hypothetical protein